MSSLKKILAMAIILSLTIVPIALTDGSDAKVDFANEAKITTGFSDMGAGTVTVSLYNDGDSVQTVTVAILNYDDAGHPTLAKTQVTVPAATTVGEVKTNGTASCDLSFSFGNSGLKYVVVNITDSKDKIISSESLDINVSHSLWKDTTTYIVIVIVVIVIAIVAYIAIRGVPGKKKKASSSDKTFTKMEAEKKSKKNGSVEITESTSAKKQTYTEENDGKRSSKRK